MPKAKRQTPTAPAEPLDPRQKRNRQAVEIPFLRIEIHWDGGMVVHDPNSMCVAGMEADYPLGQPFKDRPSILSGKPSYLYKADDLEIPLTLDELDRLVRLALRKREALKLIETYGVFHEVHDDFYVDGSSWQPRPKSKDFTAAKQRIEAQGQRVELEAEIPVAPTAAKRKL